MQSWEARTRESDVEVRLVGREREPYVAPVLQEVERDRVVLIHFGHGVEARHEHFDQNRKRRACGKRALHSSMFRPKSLTRPLLY